MPTDYRQAGTRVSPPLGFVSSRGASPQGPDKLRELGGWRASAKSSAQVQRQDYEHPPCFRPSLQLRQATNQGRQLWGRARGRGAVTASSGLGLGGCGQGPARRKREEASGKEWGPWPRPASEVSCWVGGHRADAATPLLPRPGGRRGRKGRRRRQAGGCLGMQGQGARGEGTGDRD